MTNRFASAQKALGICDVCGFQYPLRRMRSLIVKNRDTNVKACPECWNPDNPQNELGRYPVDDPQALRDPRPDNNQYASSRALIEPVRPAVGSGFIGTVTVTVI